MANLIDDNIVVKDFPTNTELVANIVAYETKTLLSVNCTLV